MLRYSYTFRGEVASKKNNRQLVQVKGRGAVLLPSKRYREWDREAKRVILAYGRPQRPFASARLTIAIYHGDAVRRDTNNATQGIQDVLVEMGVLEDDNWMVIGSPEVLHFVDVADPRMEVTVTETEPVDYKAVFKAARKEFKKKTSPLAEMLGYRDAQGSGLAGLFFFICAPRLPRGRSVVRGHSGRKGCRWSCGA